MTSKMFTLYTLVCNRSFCKLWPFGISIITLASIAFWMVIICMATTDSTSMFIRLNSSKHAHAPELYRKRESEWQGPWHMTVTWPVDMPQGTSQRMERHYRLQDNMQKDASQETFYFYSVNSSSYTQIHAHLTSYTIQSCYQYKTVSNLQEAER